MNYALEVVQIRERRDAALRAAQTRWRDEMAALVEARDTEIRRLRGEEALTRAEIARQVGCSASHVFEILSPARRAVYNRRRREHIRLVKGRAA